MLFHSEHAGGMKECWNEFVWAKGWQNSICCAGLNGVTQGTKNLW